MRMVIDITQLAGWQGKLTGIPRVMYELSTRYAEIGDETVFVGWDAGQRVFWELSFDEVIRKRKQVDSPEALGITAEQSIPSLKETMHTMFSKLPQPAKAMTRQLINMVQRTYTSRKPSMEDFKFKEGDTLLVVWGEWGDGSYRQRLVEAVEKDSVGLYQVVHDMLPLITPQYSSHSTTSLESYVKEVYPYCRKLISVSQNTKRDVSQWMTDHNLTDPDIEVIRLGENFEKIQSLKPNDSFFDKKEPYVVCVGTIETRKNHTLLYYVYKLAKTRNISLPPIVVVGRRGWLTENIYDLITTDPETKDKFIFLHNASDEELSWLYKHSLFSIYPSHYEGWGLPVAESIAHGVPCLSSNTSSMPEIAGDLIPYFTPTSTDECLMAICQLLDEQYLQRAREKIKLYQPTDWNETFVQIQRIIGDGND